VGAVHQLIVKGFYNHGWTTTHTDKIKVKQSVPAGYYGWMDMASPVTSIRADYTITLGNQTYEVPSVTVTIPAEGSLDTPLVIAHTRPIADPATACAGATQPIELPSMVSPTLGGVYRIGLRDHNRRVISAGADGADRRLKLTAFDTKMRDQEWEFDELPANPNDFMIRNAANPLLCLDQNVATHALITHACKTGSEADVANQLWTASYDPATNAYALISAINNKGVVAADSKPGSALSNQPDPSETLGRWEFLADGN
jgi:hypothetical protein